jgi:hypothetical protein
MTKKNYVVTMFAVTQVKVKVSAVDVEDAMEIAREDVEHGGGMWIYEETQFDDYVPIVDEVE